MKIEFVKVKYPGFSNPQKVLTKECFDYYWITLGYSRKKFTEILGLNHRIFTRSSNYYYNNLEIEKLRTKKLIHWHNRENHTGWLDSLEALEKFQPGFREEMKAAYTLNPLGAFKRLVEINNLMYEVKLGLKKCRKHLRSRLKRKGLLNQVPKFIANGLEYKFTKILREMGLGFKPQYKIGTKIFDFKIKGKKVLIECDGRYHTPESNKLKDKIAHKKGYILLRFTEREIKVEPLKIKECLKPYL